MELWRRAPARVRGLAIVCSKPQPDAEANLVKRAATIAQARATGVDALFDGMAQTLLGATARTRRPGDCGRTPSPHDFETEAVVAVQAGLATRPDSVPTISTINAPVLAIAGGEDPTTTPAEMEAYQAAPGGCEFHLLPDAGHFAAYEQPQKVAALFADWLRRIWRMKGSATDRKQLERFKCDRLKGAHFSIGNPILTPASTSSSRPFHHPKPKSALHCGKVSLETIGAQIRNASLCLFSRSDR